MKHKLLALLLILFLLCPVPTVHAAPASHVYTAAEVEELSGGIVAYRMSAAGVSTVQELIDTALTDTAGTTAEYDVITLSREGEYDFSSYEQALLGYLDSHEVHSAVTREKYALTLIACGREDPYIRRVCDQDIGGLGLMSLVFGLHLLNNGCESALYTAESLTDEILSRQLDDGGWAVIGTAGDADVTAMTLQALAPLCGSSRTVSGAVDRALALLSDRQLDSGGYIGMGVENCESAAQVLTALSSLGIDQNTDPRFIKNGNTVLQAMLAYRNADGSFAHTGSGFNENATIQAHYALCAFQRMLRGQSPYYIFDRPSVPEATTAPASGAPAPTAPTAAPGATPTASATDNITAAPDPTAADSPASEAPHRADSPTAATEKPRAYPTQPAHDGCLSPTGSAVFQPTGTATNRSTADEASASPGGYKPYAVLGIVLAAGIACLILILRKKRGFKRFLAVLILAAAAIAFVLLTNFESKEAFRQTTQKDQITGAVTMTIRCDTVTDEADLPFGIPADGVILPKTTFPLGADETVYDILMDAAKHYDIRVDHRGSAYVAGIDYLYEYDYGELSGWMYRVNGTFPEVGCGGYYLTDGDRIEWLYTRSIGKDL